MDIFAYNVRKLYCTLHTTLRLLLIAGTNFSKFSGNQQNHYMCANNCAAMKIHLINRTKMLHFKIAKISICQKLSAKTLKLVPTINCNLKVSKGCYKE